MKPTQFSTLDDDIVHGGCFMSSLLLDTRSSARQPPGTIRLLDVGHARLPPPFCRPESLVSGSLCLRLSAIFSEPWSV